MLPKSAKFLKARDMAKAFMLIEFACFLAGPTGIEPATYGLRVRRSNLTELRARLSLGKEPRRGKDIELSVSISRLMCLEVS